MKRMLRLLMVVIVMSFSMGIVAFANQWNWETISGHHNQSILLTEGESIAKDTIYRYGRGDYLAEGSVQIVNNQDGTLRVDVSTLAHVNVDKILHSVFLDVWDDTREAWVNLSYWDFVVTKEEMENNELFMLETSFTLTGYEVGRYYRLRGLHGVELYDELEACATETHGVQLTDWLDW